MRTILALLGTCWLLLDCGACEPASNPGKTFFEAKSPPAPRSGTQNPPATVDPRAIVDRAIQAHGGEANLARWNIGYLKAKVLQVNRFPIVQEDASWEETFALPGRLRRELRYEDEMGQERSILDVVNGSRAWERKRMLGVTRTFNRDRSPPRVASVYSAVSTLSGLKGDQVDLEYLGTIHADEGTLLRVQAASPSRGPLEYAFNQQTGLLIDLKGKGVVPATQAEISGKILFRDYHEVEDCLLPQRVTVYEEGEVALDVRVVEARCLDRVDDSLFAEPESSQDHQP